MKTGMNTLELRRGDVDPPSTLPPGTKRGVEAITPAELATFRAYVRFGSQQAAATELGIALGTVKNQVSAVLWRLNANSSVQAAVILDRLERCNEGSGD